jgi:hypothetical protein
MIPLTLGICLILYFVVSKITVTLDNDEIVLKTLLTTSTLAWKDIVSSKLSLEVHAHTGEIRWLITDENGKGLGISPTYFSRRGNRIIAEVLVSKCLFANISDKVRNMAVGKFPWYIF